jgi:hypothetical protein
MKGKCWFSKMQKYFEISKWTKKMSKIGMPKKSLLRKIYAYDIEKLSSQDNV